MSPLREQTKEEKKEKMLDSMLEYFEVDYRSLWFMLPGPEQYKRTSEL